MYTLLCFKGEAYYKSLGYKTLMEGVIGEAEKEGKYALNCFIISVTGTSKIVAFVSKILLSGRGDEVRARIEKFSRESKTKGLVTLGAFIALFFNLKINYPYVHPL